jgi:hypothetical protein
MRFFDADKMLVNLGRINDQFADLEDRRVCIEIAGILAGIGVVIGLDYINPHFKSEDELGASLQVPLLVSIPEVVTEKESRAAVALDRNVYIAAVSYVAILGILFVEAFMFRYLGISLVKW